VVHDGFVPAHSLIIIIFSRINNSSFRILFGNIFLRTLLALAILKKAARRILKIPWLCDVQEAVSTFSHFKLIYETSAFGENK
jgi:hypothetical protein